METVQLDDDQPGPSEGTSTEESAAPAPPAKKARVKKISLEELLASSLSSSQQALGNLQKDNQRDVAAHFGDYVAARMRNLSPQQGVVAQAEIMRILADIELNIKMDIGMTFPVVGFEL